MKVVLSTISKFHTFDLARQLEKRGSLNRLFTGRPRWKIREEGIDPQKVATFPWLQTLYEALARLGPKEYPFERELNWRCHITLDTFVAKHLPDADIFHALSYCGLWSGLEAQRRGMKWGCDVVNSHALFQETLLIEEHERLGLPYRRQEKRFLDYAEESYACADFITVPSLFAYDSFLSEGIPQERLMTIPYGVDLSRYRPTGSPDPARFRVLFVGQLSIRKGIHDLAEGFRRAAIPQSELILVGSLQPESERLLGPRDDRIHAVGPKPKAALSEFYSQADVMVLPSIEDGFGYVIGEAMACGCPVIASTNTGGRDFFTDGIEGFIVPIRSPDAIAEKLVWLYEHPTARAEMRARARARVETLGGWDSYGAGMTGLFQKIASGSPLPA